VSTLLRCANGHVWEAPAPEFNPADSDLTPEQLAQLEEVIDHVDPHESDYLKRLRELKLGSRADRNSVCGKYYRYYKHGAKNGQPEHVWKSPASRCMLRSCPFDAKVQAFEQIQKFLPVEKLVISHFTYLEISFPLTEPGPTQVLAKKLQVLLSRNLPHKGTLTKLGYRRDIMVLKALHCTAITNDARIALSLLVSQEGATMTTMIYHRSEFPKVLKLTMGMEIPIDGRTRAEFEATLAYMKQITSVGIPKEFVQDKALYTNTMEFESPIDPRIKVRLGIKRCPKCGILPEFCSDWVMESHSIDKLRNKKWHTHSPDPPN